MRPISLAMLALVCGCSSGDAAPEGSSGRFRPVVDVQQLMLSVVEPAAETYWDAVGWIMDAQGTHEIRPTSEEEWEAVRNAAVTVAEAGNLLMMEGRAVDDDAWIAMSQTLVAAGERAIRAAEARDEAAVFETGGDLYAACTACHASYATQTLRPSFRSE